MALRYVLCPHKALPDRLVNNPGYKTPPLLPERRTTVNDGTMLGRISLSRRENPLTLT